jgi:selenocysteine-specific elongation factor
VDQGKLVKIAEGLYLHRESIEQAGRLMRDHLAKEGRITVSQFRDLTGTSRKYAVPLLEHFDSIRVTRRAGDDRVLYGR